MLCVSMLFFFAPPTNGSAFLNEIKRSPPPFSPTELPCMPALNFYFVDLSLGFALYWTAFVSSCHPPQARPPHFKVGSLDIRSVFYFSRRPVGCFVGGPDFSPPHVRNPRRFRSFCRFFRFSYGLVYQPRGFFSSFFTGDSRTPVVVLRARRFLLV